MSRKSHIQTVVFDFDGVIVDSNRIKADAWQKIFRDSKGVPLELVEEAREKIRATRFDILRYIFSQLGKEKKELERLVEEYANRYHVLVQEGIFHMGVSGDVFETLKKLKEKYSLYINSATPEDALRDTVVKLEIDRLFKDVLGKPESKENNLVSIIGREGVSAENVVVVGDGEDDKEAAYAVGCHFIGVSNEYNRWERERFLVLRGVIEVPGSITLLEAYTHRS